MYLCLGLLILGYMSLWFIVSLITKRNDVADIAWGLGFVLVSWTALSFSDVVSQQGLLVASLVTVWGVRLAIHIARRNWGRPEDYRYSAWRAAWGRWFYLRSFAQVYVLQGALMFLIALPTVFVMQNGGDVTLLTAIGVAVWLMGFLFEVVGDAQLAQFIRNPENKGRLLRTGLWRFTRHPNYFGEVALWWGIWLIAASLPGGLFTVVGPLTISILILKISGVPLLEEKMKNNPEFAEYARTTSVFIPWFVKK